MSKPVYAFKEKSVATTLRGMALMGSTEGMPLPSSPASPLPTPISVPRKLMWMVVTENISPIRFEPKPTGEDDLYTLGSGKAIPVYPKKRGDKENEADEYYNLVPQTEGVEGNEEAPLKDYERTVYNYFRTEFAAQCYESNSNRDPLKIESHQTLILAAEDWKGNLFVVHEGGITKVMVTETVAAATWSDSDKRITPTIIEVVPFNYATNTFGGSAVMQLTAEEPSVKMGVSSFWLTEIAVSSGKARFAQVYNGELINVDCEEVDYT